MLSKDRNGCALNTPEAVAGAAYVHQLFDQKLVPSGDANGENLFTAGKIGVYFNGRWFTPGLRQNAKLSRAARRRLAGR